MEMKARALNISILTMLFCVPLLGADTNADATTERAEIKRFRFQRHAKHNFERLVIEFGGQSKSTAPNVKVSPNPAEKSVSVNVSNLTLVGAIPEAAMNESFVPQSKYLGAIHINTDSGSSVTIKVGLKDASLKGDAFWLQSPSRLVIDAFPGNSPRVSGPAVLASHPVAAPIGPTLTKETKGATPPASVKAAIDGNAKAPLEAAADTKPSKRLLSANKKVLRDYICFPVNAQVMTSISYESANGDSEKIAMRLETDGTPATPPSVTSSDGIACYPRSSQVKALISFKSANPQPEPSTESQSSNSTENAPVSPSASNEPVNVPVPMGRGVSSSPTTENETKVEGAN